MYKTKDYVKGQLEVVYITFAHIALAIACFKPHLGILQLGNWSFCVPRREINWCLASIILSLQQTITAFTI